MILFSLKELPVRQQIKVGCAFLLVGAVFMFIIYKWSEERREIRTETRTEHWENFRNNVKFSGEVLQIRQLGSRHRSSFLFCIRLNDLEIDYEGLREDNLFYQLEDGVLAALFSSPVYDNEKYIFENSTKVAFNKNNEGKIIAYSISGDSIDITRRNHGFMNKSRRGFCQEFIER